MNRRPLALAAAVLLPLLLLAPAHADRPASSPPRTAMADSVPFTATKTVSRDTWVPAGGGTFAAYTTSRTVTVHVDHTANLRGRERVLVSWSGATPSGARAANPYGENGLNQEYPVVILQCRGTDAGSVPAPQQVTPQTCWTSSYFQRSQVAASPGQAIWLKDPHSLSDARLQGMTPFPDGATCPSADVSGYDTILTPFKAVDGKVYPACSAKTMPPEAAVGGAYPPSEISAFSDSKGNGSTLFEVRSEVENASLGCSHTVACTIEVIPIMGTSCTLPGAAGPDDADKACNRAGQFAAGSSNFAANGVDAAVSPSYWWTPGNWANRISVPINFALPPDTCDVLDPRAPTGFYGSELLSQASMQWAPAYCLDKKRFKYQHNVLPDAAGFMLMQNGEAPAAEVSGPHDAGATPVAYAPTALTGFGIGYVIDKPDNAGMYTGLRLDARLLAKLLTESYTGSSFGREHPGMGNNPTSINLDPEFKALNPGLSTNEIEAASTLLSLSESSDVMTQLTDYIKSDKDAMAFLDGKPDPWGMVVNPNYKGMSLPQAQWPLLDDFTPPAPPGDECRAANPSVYLNQVAAPVTKLLTIAQALIDAWPNVQTRCDVDLSTQPHSFKVGRVDRQSYGARFMLGIVSLGDAARYGLDVASLQAAPGRFVAPTAASEARAVTLMTQPEALGPFVLDQSKVRKDGRAYPGTMVVYTVARTQHLDRADADKVAEFIRISTTEGQVPGSGNGRLPAGFVPIEKTGGTASLFSAARAAAKAIAAQQVPAAPAPSPSPQPGPQGSVPPTSDVTAGGGGAVPAAGAPAEAPAPSATPTAASVAAPVIATQTVRTQLVSSRTGDTLIPALLLLGLVGAVTSVLTRLLARRRSA